MTKQILLSTPHMGSLEQEFVKEAFDTNWIAPVGPHDPHPDPSVGPAARPRLAQLVLGPEHGDDAELGRAVDLVEEPVAELGGDLLLERVGNGRGVHDHGSQ